MSLGRLDPIFPRLISPDKIPGFLFPRVLEGTTEHFGPETLKWVRTVDLELLPDLSEFTVAVLR